MKVRGEFSIYCGQHERFHISVAQKMVGQRTKDGSVIISAKQIDAKEIRLTVEKDA